MRILVVDDERAYAEMLRRLLRRLGHDPVVALDPRDALDLLDENIAAVITDIDMPFMSGVEMAREIQRRVGAVPIVFCTGSDPANHVSGDARTIGPVLPKATSIETARAAVEHMRLSAL